MLQIATKAETFQNNIIARNNQVRDMYVAGSDLATIANSCIATKRFSETADEKIAVVRRVLGV